MNSSWRGWLRSAASVAAGLLTAAAVQLALAAAWWQYSPGDSSTAAHIIAPGPPPEFLLLSAAAGAFVSARLAPRAPLGHAAAVAACLSLALLTLSWPAVEPAELGRVVSYHWLGAAMGGLLGRAAARPRAAHVEQPG